MATPSTQSLTSKDSSTSTAISSSNFNEIKDDLNIMLKYAIENGIQIPNTFNTGEELNITDIISNYNALTVTIAPASVQSIRFINTQIIKGNQARHWYQIPIFSKCLGIAILSLIVLVSISLSPDVNDEQLAAGLLTSSGWILLYNLLFILSASLLGVMFFLLKTLSSKIKDYTLLPVDAIEINATVIIGLISGFIISELFVFTNTTISGSLEVNKMTMALLGGFSSDAIFSTLQGIVNKIKSFLTPTS